MKCIESRKRWQARRNLKEEIKGESNEGCGKKENLGMGRKEE